ncbi:hypothetical protein D3C80_2217670 [compost metagenome]
MNTIVNPGNTHYVATLFEQSQILSRHTMSSREIAERAAFDPMVMPKVLARLAEINIGASL